MVTPLKSNLRTASTLPTQFRPRSQRTSHPLADWIALEDSNVRQFESPARSLQQVTDPRRVFPSLVSYFISIFLGLKTEHAFFFPFFFATRSKNKHNQPNTDSTPRKELLHPHWKDIAASPVGCRGGPFGPRATAQPAIFRKQFVGVGSKTWY